MVRDSGFKFWGLTFAGYWIATKLCREGVRWVGGAFFFSF